MHPLYPAALRAVGPRPRTAAGRRIRGRGPKPAGFRPVLAQKQAEYRDIPGIPLPGRWTEVRSTSGPRAGPHGPGLLARGEHRGSGGQGSPGPAATKPTRSQQLKLLLASDGGEQQSCTRRWLLQPAKTGARCTSFAAAGRSGWLHLRCNKAPDAAAGFLSVAGGA